MLVEEARMEMRTPARRCRAALAMFFALGLAGCDSVYTLHSICEPSDEPSTVPDLSGLWALSDADAKGMLRIAAEDYDVGHRREADIRWFGASSQEDQTIGDAICFVPVAGHLVAEVRTTGQVQLFQQILFKFDQQSISLCDAAWVELLEWAGGHPEASAVHGIEFVRRGSTFGTEFFITSSANEIRTYLEARLPQLAKACDADDDDGPAWTTYTRLTPPRPPGDAVAIDTPPSTGD
jgi:hypothetical protein